MADDVNGAVCSVGWEVEGKSREGERGGELNATRDEERNSIFSPPFSLHPVNGGLCGGTRDHGAESHHFDTLNDTSGQ